MAKKRMRVNQSVKELQGLGISEADAMALEEEITQADSDKDAERVMVLANDLMEAYGVEALRDEDAYDSYYGDVVATYVNTGDTYNITLLYDVRNGDFFVTSWGDWFEAYEQEKEEEQGALYIVRYALADPEDFTHQLAAIIRADDEDEAKQHFIDNYVDPGDDDTWLDWTKDLDGDTESAGDDSWYITGQLDDETDEGETDTALLTIQDVKRAGSLDDARYELEREKRKITVEDEGE